MIVYAMRLEPLNEFVSPRVWVAARLACPLLMSVAWLVPLFAAEQALVDFDRDVAPILIESCLGCHGGDEPKGGLNLMGAGSALRGGETGTVIVPGDSDASLLWQFIESEQMPPEKPLRPHEKELLRQWITGGAAWGTDPIDPLDLTTRRRAGRDWWSLRPVSRPVVPQSLSLQARNPIDAFVGKRLEAGGLTASPPATSRVLIRRLYFDLLGLPPQADDVSRWLLAFDECQTAATNRLVSELLASRHYGERWGRHWLDVVRFGESQGFERDKLRPDSWYYRQWVIDAMNRDLPYDEFVCHQIAGDVLLGGAQEAITATGFLVAGPWDEVGQAQRSAAMKAVVRQDEIEDYVGTIGQTFLGLTTNCARCHDHKFDPITQREYYRLAAAVAGVHHGSRQVVAAKTQQPHSVYAVVPSEAQATYVLHRGNPNSRLDRVLPGGVGAVSGVDSEFGLDANSPEAARRRALADWITDTENPLFSRVIVNRLWHHHFGTGLVETPNDFGFNGGRPSHPQLLDWLASELVRSGWSLKHVQRLIVTSATYEQSSRSREECLAVDADNRLCWRMSPQRLEAESLRDAILSVSGQLNVAYGGAPYRDFTTYVNNTQFYTMTDPDDHSVYRRTVYRTWIRSGRSHFLDVFDCPDPSTTAPRRAVTTTPIQSLALMNNSFVLRMAGRFAGRVKMDVGDDPYLQARRAYELAYSRSPAASEWPEITRFVKHYGLAALCRVIFNSNEFIYVD
jgi:cytochrome c553